MNGHAFFVGYEFKRLLRFLAVFFILGGFVLLISVPDKAEILALSLVLMLVGFYVFSLKTYIEIKEDKFRIVTISFYLFDSGSWISKSTYPLTSLKSVQKTYALPRISRHYSADILIQDMDQRVVLTDAYQRRFINLKDFKNGKDATQFINKVNRFLGTEYAMWGSRMKR